MRPPGLETAPEASASPAPARAPAVWGADLLEQKRRAIREHYDRIAGQREQWIARNAYYYRRLTEFLRFVIEPQRRVLEIRSDTGYLLAAVEPSHGVGVDVSEGLVAVARRLHPGLRFEVQDPERLRLQETFDYVVINSIHDLVDIQATFSQLGPVTGPSSRVVVLGYNYLWRPLVRIAEAVGWKVPQPIPNWLSADDIKNLLALEGFQTIKTYGLFLMPVGLPLVADLLNRVVARLPGFRRLCLLYAVVARPAAPRGRPQEPMVSVVVPCKDERGNIESAVRRIPPMGRKTEIIFCDDRSTDGTADEIRRMQARFPERDIRLVRGPGICKALNVWAGFDEARGDILMILDADLTTMPEELPYFYRALVEGRGEFINGSRMVYPMEGQAMRGLNILGNTFFSWAFTFLLGQRIKDTLCGTKALWRADYARVKTFRGGWGVTDRWGDYELLFGAARLHLKIVDLPVHYMERIYGQTKMTKRFRNALVMLRMCQAALLKLKFV